MIKTQYVDINYNLYRLIPKVSGTQNFTRTTTNDILLTVIFHDLTEHITVVTNLTEQAWAQLS